MKNISLVFITACCAFVFVNFAKASDINIEGPGLTWRPLYVEDTDRPQYRLWHELVWLGQRRAGRMQGGEKLPDHHPEGDYYPRVDVSGEGIDLSLPRAFARPGDRWVEAFVEVESSRLEADGDLVIEARLFNIHFDGEGPVAQLTIRPETHVGKLKVDLRRHGLSQARLSVELFQNGERRGACQATVSAQPPDRELEDGERIAVEVDTPDGMSRERAVPVTFGVPFPAGSLWDPDRVRLITDDGGEVPAQMEVTGRWSAEGAVKWMRFDTDVVPAEGLMVEITPAGAKSMPTLPLRLEHNEDQVTIDTGVARYELGVGASPIRKIWRDGHQIAGISGARGLYVVDQTGRVGVASADGQTMEVEAAGPLAACVRFEGFYRTEDGEQLARHITRVEAFAGQPHVVVTHTLVLTRNSKDVWFRDIGWELSVDPGDKPDAVFNASAGRWDEYIPQRLDQSTASAYVFQEEHLRFGGGEKRFHAGRSDAGGDVERLHEGEEMGDWAALIGEEGGFLASVSDAARQHPKEFEVKNDKMVIRLFSNRNGDELDFRVVTLAEEWGLSDSQHELMARRAGESNAKGWAKTHQLLFSPLDVNSPRESAAWIGRLNSEPVYVHVDPDWIGDTGALGVLHPRDPENYPDLEAKVDDLIELWGIEGRFAVFGGFRDYNIGPVFSGRASRNWITAERRFRSSYQLRESLWRLYARSGDRDIRTFAAGSTRAYTDNYVAHWDGPDRIKGLFHRGRGGHAPRVGPGDMPMYWQGTTEDRRYTLRTRLEDYYLTGNRRAADLIDQFSEGIKRERLRPWDRPSVAALSLAEAYSFTHDPELRALVEALTSKVYDPEADIGVFWTTTDKPWLCLVNYLDTWNILGTPPHYDIVMRGALKQFWRRVGGIPWGASNPFAHAANFLYHYTEDPVILKGLQLWTRQYIHSRAPGTAPSTLSFSQGVFYAQDTLSRAREQDLERVAWVGWRDDDLRPVHAVVEKSRPYETLDLWVRTGSPGPLQGGAWVRALDPPARWRDVGDRTFVRMDVNSIQTPGISGAGGMAIAKIRFAKEAPADAYAVRPPHHGVQTIFARVNEFDNREQWRSFDELEATRPPRFVLHAPRGWQTSSTVRETRVFFRLPEDASAARIYFSAPALLFDPEGNLYEDSDALEGWVDLPPENPGLWSFQTSEAALDVEVENLPPFFAFDNPDSYFEPSIPWVQWRSPMPDAELHEEVHVDFRVHLPGQAGVNVIRVFWDDKRLYEGKSVPEDLYVSPSDVAQEGSSRLRVVVETEEYESEHAIEIKAPEKATD